jgi:hypothetical protein
MDRSREACRKLKVKPESTYQKINFKQIKMVFLDKKCSQVETPYSNIITWALRGATKTIKCLSNP